VVPRYASRLFLLAALLWVGFAPSAFAVRAPSVSALVPSENRVGGSGQFASGRLSIEDQQSPINTPGLEGCGYETASGRLKWLNRDPIQESGGINLYRFVSNNPLKKIDRFGLAPMSGGVGGPQMFPPGGKRPGSCPEENCNPFTLSDRAIEAQNRNHNLQLDPDPYQGAYRHCVAACLMSRCFGPLGNAATYARDIWEEDDSENSHADILGEQRGMDHANNSPKSCEAACLDTYPPMQGPPRPPPPGAGL